MDNRIGVGKAAEILGVSVQTVRNMENRGEIKCIYKTPRGTRYFSKEELEAIANKEAVVGNKKVLVLKDKNKELKEYIRELCIGKEIVVYDINLENKERISDILITIIKEKPSAIIVDANIEDRRLVEYVHKCASDEMRVLVV